MTQRLILTVLASTLFIASSIAYAEDNIKNIPKNTLAWTTTPEGVAFAPLIGDRFVESYMAMVKLPAGLVSPAHAKTSNMFGVMISGSMVHSIDGANPENDMVLPEGSFYKIPKNVPHISKCISETDCITFLYQDGKFDFLPVKKQSK